MENRSLGDTWRGAVRYARLLGFASGGAARFHHQKINNRLCDAKSCALSQSVGSAHRLQGESFNPQLHQHNSRAGKSSEIL